MTSTVESAADLRRRSRALLRKRLLSLGITDAARTAMAEEALQKELALIEQHDIASLFSFLCDCGETLLREEIPVQAIGTASGSMILFACGLSHVFPPDDGLSFEHFFDGSKFYSVGRKIYLSLDVPGRMSGRMMASWTKKARPIRGNGIGVKIEWTPRHYLSTYRRLRHRSQLLPPTSVRSYWPQIDPSRIIPTATRFFAREYADISWCQESIPLTWSQLVLRCGRSEERSVDVQLLIEFAAQGQALRKLDADAREAETRAIVQSMLCYREDVMARLHRTLAISESLVSQLMLAVCKQQPERIALMQEMVFSESRGKNRSAAEIESEFDLIVSRAAQVQSKSHACSRALWVAYLAYARSRVQHPKLS